MESIKLTEPELLVNDHHGIYVGKVFCESYANAIKNKAVLQKDIDICLIGPEHEDYIEAWIEVVDNAILINDYGQELTVGNIGESGDLWAIPEGYEFPEF